MLPILPDRTTCKCDQCREGCLSTPGFLVPLDLLAYKEKYADNDTNKLFLWAEEHLLASPGALVMKAGTTFRIETLVPSRQGHQKTGPCHWLDASGLCTIHEHSPFGCRMFDWHMNDDEGDRRASFGLQMVFRDHLSNGLYSQVWHHLHRIGKRGLTPTNQRKYSRTK